MQLRQFSNNDTDVVFTTNITRKELIQASFSRDVKRTGKGRVGGMFSFVPCFILENDLDGQIYLSQRVPFQGHSTTLGLLTLFDQLEYSERKRGAYAPILCRIRSWQ